MSGGSLYPEIEKDISFSLDKEQYSRGETITVSTSITDEKGTVFDCTDNMTNWNIIITCQNIQVKTSSTNEIQTETFWPQDTYQINITATYEGILYNASFEIKYN